MVILFVTNMHGGFESAQPIATQKGANLGGWISSPQTEIISGLSYVICPVQAGFEYTKSLFNKFDEVIFLKEHNNYVVRIQQAELEQYVSPVEQRTTKDETRMMFFGCSHTAGEGHDSVESTYPNVLSNMLNVDYINLGMPGKSNYDIEDLLNQYQIKSAQVIVQFTDMYRVRYKDNKIQSSPIHRIDPLALNKKLLSEENLLFNFQELTNRVINRLREGDNKFLITFTCNYENEYDLYCLEHLLQYREFSSHVGTAVDVATDGAHYGVKSHKLWAEKLFNKWIELYDKQ